MARYSWQQKDWPHFEYSLQSIEDELFLFAEKTGKVAGILNDLPQSIQTEAIIDIMVSEAIKTSEIEGEYLAIGEHALPYARSIAAAFDPYRQDSQRRFSSAI